MANDGAKEEYYVECPFYKKTELKRLGVRCEGPTPSSRLVIQFNTKKKLDEYAEMYCKSIDYTKCAVCQILMRKYE